MTILSPSAQDEIWPHAIDARALNRFASKVKIGQPSECWIWQAFINDKGYGQFRLGSHKRAHRVSYEWARHPIPDGLVIDHLCRTRACVNPDHLEPVTSRVNTLRGETLAAECVAKTHCPQGHPYDEANTISEGNGRFRRCRECARAADRRETIEARAHRIPGSPKCEPPIDPPPPLIPKGGGPPDSTGSQVIFFVRPLKSETEGASWRRSMQLSATSSIR